MLTIKELYDYCKQQGVSDAEMEIHYHYECNDSDSHDYLELDDFEIERYMDSYDNGKTWQEYARLILHYYK